MRHQNSVFHRILQFVPWAEFDRLVEEHRADKRARGFKTKTQLAALIYGQLAGAASLREIETGLRSHSARRYHVGMGEVRRSSLADANAHRPVEVFSGLLACLMAQASRQLRRKLAAATYLIDSTSLPLSGRSRWAQFSAKVCGAKAHIVYDPTADQPVYSVVSAANVNDITVAQAMPIVPGASYVFDLGYYDYGWWAKLDGQGCHFVTRLKCNTPLRDIKETRPVPPGSNILSDRVGYLPERQAGNRKNPFQKPIREVVVRIDTGKILRIATNNLTASAEEIADLYKLRWQIELFFRWVKQTLRITHFLGTSENAVRIQIAAALITFLLLRLAQATQTAISSPLEFARLVRANLMHKRDLAALVEPDPPPLTDPNQLVLV